MTGPDNDDRSQPDSAEHRAWRRDRALRQRIPLREAWRGSVGLALLFDDVDGGECHGDRVFYPNGLLRWAAVRDVPVGRCPASPAMNRREVSWATVAPAALRHGMPCVDLSASPRTSWDFRFLPYGTSRRRSRGGRGGTNARHAYGDVLNSDEYPREFAVLNRVSHAMTRLAFRGTDSRGRPVRRSWFDRRPPGQRLARVVSPGRWMPRAYLAFHETVAADRLFHLATTDAREPASWVPCPHCRRTVPLSPFRDASAAATTFFPDGDFAARCPRCGRLGKWHLDEAVAEDLPRHFPQAFRLAFTDAVAVGLPLATPTDAVYLGTDPAAAADEGDGAAAWPLSVHLLRDAGGRVRRVRLPAHARPLARPGQALAAGEVWCRALPVTPPAAWLALDGKGRWATVHEACGGRAVTGRLQAVWFEHQCVRLGIAPGLALWPADLVAPAVARDLTPAGLWWDAAPAEPWVDADVSAAILPQLTLSRWNRLRFQLPGDVLLDAGITDPRFDLGHPGDRRDGGRPEARGLTEDGGASREMNGQVLVA